MGALKPGVNDLASQHPQLSLEWHPSKNGVLTPADVALGSNKKVWWLGSCGHEWLAQVANRTGLGRGCAVCSGAQVQIGVNDLASRSPEAAALWHPSKNGELTPYEVSSGSSKKFWWQCGLSHDWLSSVNNVVRGNRCPVCSGRQAWPGFNDLTTTHPHIAALWDAENNPDRSVADVLAGSGYRVAWVCPSGHRWTAIVKECSSAKDPCPVCAGRTVVAGVNDLATTHPHLAAQWHPEKNEMSATELTVATGRSFWWVCDLGHEWNAPMPARKSGTGCPACASNMLVVGFNDMATTRPDMAVQWHPTRNAPVTPQDVFAGTNKKYWWVCDLGHDYEASGLHRTHGKECSVCAGKVVLSGFNDLATSHPFLAAQWHPQKNGSSTPDGVASNSHYKAWWRCGKGHEWQTWVYARAGLNSSNGCPTCSMSIMVSDQEREMVDFIEKLGFEVETSNRKILGRQELDIYIPAKKIGVEFNGLYWHSERFRDSTYHLKKHLLAEKAGVRLIQVWEDEWLRRKPVVQRMLAAKLGATSRLVDVDPLFARFAERIGARSTRVVEATVDVARDFLEENHIQGFASGGRYYGLADQHGVVRALMVLRRESDGVFNIVRYATYGNIPGGFTKLLTHAERTLQPTAFITFADRTISDGGLYESHGFIVDKVLDPDYSYVVGKERRHKFGYRLKRFRNDPDLVCEEGRTERELAELNGLVRIWDAGKVRYRKDVLTDN